MLYFSLNEEKCIYNMTITEAEVLLTFVGALAYISKIIST